MYFILKNILSHFQHMLRMKFSSLFFYFLLVSFAGAMGCKKKESAVAGSLSKNIVKSPFTGKWISEDSGKDTAFRLSIEHRKDSLFGNYCLVRAGGRKCDCYAADLMVGQYAFTVPVTEESTLETLVKGNWNNQGAGRLRLSAVENKLYWRIVEEQAGNNFMIKQTTFVRDTSFY